MIFGKIKKEIEEKGAQFMLAVAGYYDGIVVKPLEHLAAKPNQRVMITVIDDFISPDEQGVHEHSGRKNFMSLAGKIDIDGTAVAELREGSKI